MTTNKPFITALTFAFALAAVPAFAQHGLGVGGALGGAHTAINTAGNAASTATAGANTTAGTEAGTAASVQANTSGAVKSGVTGQAAAAGQSNGAGIVTHIDNNPQLASQVQSMLPPGESLSAATAGFKNEGQFLAALHASGNLGIPFDQLKTKMTGSDDLSLGAAIKASKPNISQKGAKDQAKKAEHEAKNQIEAKANATATDADAKTSATASSAASVKN